MPTSHFTDISYKIHTMRQAHSLLFLGKISELSRSDGICPICEMSKVMLNIY